MHTFVWGGNTKYVILQQCTESACVLSGCYAWCVGHLARDASNVCTLTHQSELVQGLLGSTSQLGDMPGLQNTQVGMLTRELLYNLTLTWALKGLFDASGCIIDVKVMLD